MDNRFLIGSAYFFSFIPGYIAQDTDYVFFTKNPDDKISIYNHIDNTCLFYITDKFINDKNYFIKTFIENCKELPFSLILQHDICKLLNLNIEDIKYIYNTIDLSYALNKSHTYLKYILECYIENNKIVLYVPQLLQAYELYKKYKVEISF